MPKIFSGWKSANWQPPRLREETFPAQTLLELSTASLIPQDVLDDLHQQFGAAFDQLDDFERLIVATTATEKWINHKRACQLTTRHSREVTLTLLRLENKGFLIANGEQRNKYYTLPSASVMTPDEVLSLHIVTSPTDNGGNLTQNEGNLTQNGGNLAHNGGNLTHNGGNLAHNGGNLAHSGGNLTHNEGNLAHNGGNLAYNGESSTHNGENNQVAFRRL